MSSQRRKRSSDVTAGLTHYATLGVYPGDDHATIEAAYWALARKHHPDAGGSVENFQVLSEAWGVLKFAVDRRRYDQELAMRLQACPKCQGKGYRVQQGIRTRNIIQCAVCHGIGFSEKRSK